jgi:hypothetical protein
MLPVAERGGYFFVIDEWRREHGIEGQIETKGTFTEAVSAPDWEHRDAEIVFLSLDGSAIDYVCLGTRGRRAATLKNQIRFANFYHFDPPIALDEVADEFTARLRPHLIRTSAGNGRRVPPSTWAELLNIVRQMRPASADALHFLERMRRQAMQRWNKVRTVIEERDAVNIALRASRMDERELLTWNPGDDKDPPEPFLSALLRATSYEAQMIEHDSRVFGDWTRAPESNLRGAHVFRRGGRRLTVLNVNTRSVETTLGVDLIYYAARYESYVLVQYKRMVREVGDELAYRPIDASYKRELAAMEKFEADFCEADGGDLRSYRLHPNPFYFKVCESDSCSVATAEMVPGMYLPLDYWRRVVGSPNSRGPRGGVRISRDTAQRYVTNSLFVNLVQEGWIGSRTCRSDVISRIVEAWLKDGHSLILAGCFDEGSDQHEQGN